jgi:D-arabinose 1-dehydrogenase-like Zn-dependent alcohol dehydrogenase
MAPFGHIYPLTITEGTLDFPYLPLIIKELSIHGSCSSSPEEVDKMLQFIIAHGIKPVVQRFPMSVPGITDAFEKLESGSIRYRAVLEV